MRVNTLQAAALLARSAEGMLLAKDLPYFLFDLLLHRAAKRTKMETRKISETALRLWNRNQSKLQRLKLPLESFVMAGWELRPPSKIVTARLKPGAAEFGCRDKF
jgi:hypothetical protein